METREAAGPIFRARVFKNTKFETLLSMAGKEKKTGVQLWSLKVGFTNTV